MREWRQLAPPGEDVEARRAELEAICLALLRELDHDHLWLVWQIVRDHLNRFTMEQLADVKGVRESKRWVAKECRSALKRLRQELKATIRLRERASKRKW